MLHYFKRQVSKTTSASIAKLADRRQSKLLQGTWNGRTGDADDSQITTDERNHAGANEVEW